MRYNRTFIVRVNGIEVARYSGHPGSSFQVASNHAFDIYKEYEKRAMNGEPEYANSVITINNKNILEYM